MDEREEIIVRLKEVRKLVAGLTAHLPFSEETSRYLDWLDQRIEQMENRE